MKVNKKVSKLIIFTLTSSITMMSFNSLVFADNFNKTYVDNKISDPIIKIEESEYFEEKTADRPVPMMTASALALGGGKEGYNEQKKYKRQSKLYYFET